MRWYVCMGILVAAAGCGGGPVVVGGGSGAGMSDECNASRQRGLVGRQIDDYAAVTTAAPKVRLINPGDAVSQDHRPDRLNIVFGSDGRVDKVYCG